MQDEMRNLHEQERNVLINQENLNGTRANPNDVPYDVIYERTEHDIRNKHSTVPHHLPLKEVRIMIPEFYINYKNF